MSARPAARASPMTQQPVLRPGSCVIHVHIPAVHRKPGRTALIRRAARAALAQARPLPARVELTLKLTDDAELRALNRRFRGVDRPTDVLSFGGETFKDGAPKATLADEGVIYLGDIAISMERCATQARAFGHAPDDELALMVIHGVLHLLGYEHSSPSRKRRMWQAQDRAFALLGRTNPLKPDQFHD